MNILYTYPETIVDGEGIRYSIYLAGCRHGCPGCHNPESWNPQAGDELTEKRLDCIIREINSVTGWRDFLRRRSPLQPGSVSSAYPEDKRRDRTEYLVLYRIYVRRDSGRSGTGCRTTLYRCIGGRTLRTGSFLSISGVQGKQQSTDLEAEINCTKKTYFSNEGVSEAELQMTQIYMDC